MNQWFVSILLLLANCYPLQAQDKWENPSQQNLPVIRGRAWNKELSGTYNRLPLRVKEMVRTPVWDLSCQSAGLSVGFYSNAPEIKVRYVVRGGLSMEHMPATGVSGVDLYATDANGRQRWCAGQYAFGDTITYRYSGLSYEDDYHHKGYEYQLFLPLYNTVLWLEIGVRENSFFQFIPISQEKPLVVYGTSIAQGACASRPGMAWGNIVGRMTEYPVVNLGFSGNGRLESELFDLLAEIDARMYIIDCMPNLSGEESSKLIYDRTLSGVKMLRRKSAAPILLVEHSGYTNEWTSKTAEASYRVANTELRKGYETLQKEGVAELYYLTKEQLGLSMDAMVEGVHPSDLGMQQYADSYIKTIKMILHEAVGAESTCIPCKQRREPDTYEWSDRHEQILNLNKTQAPEILMIGNSITHYWAGEPLASVQAGAKSWAKLFAGKTVRNFGFGWDKVENVLWRVCHGELDGYQAKHIFLMIGTNNLQSNTDDEIVAGICLLAKTIGARQPGAELCVVGVLPRQGMEARVKCLNEKLQGQLLQEKITYLDLSPQLITNTGSTDLTLFRDGLHPNEKGYERMAKELEKQL